MMGPMRASGTGMLSAGITGHSPKGKSRHWKSRQKNNQDKTGSKSASLKMRLFPGPEVMARIPMILPPHLSGTCTMPWILSRIFSAIFLMSPVWVDCASRARPNFEGVYLLGKKMPV